MVYPLNGHPSWTNWARCWLTLMMRPTTLTITPSRRCWMLKFRQLMMCRNVQQLANPLLMRLPLRGRCFSPVPPHTEPLGHGDFGTSNSTFFPPFFTKPADVRLILSVCLLKGELHLDKKWQSDDLFYIIVNEIHPRFNQFCVILKLS